MLHVDGMHGLGDSIYQRAFIKTLAKKGDITLATPWPQLVRDLHNVIAVPKATRMRTQLKNTQRSTFDRPTHSISMMASRRNGYDIGEPPLAGMARHLGVAPSGFDLPAMPVELNSAKWARPVAIVRPVTLRREYSQGLRNPRAEYVNAAAAALRAAGFVVLSMADLEDGEEWLDGAAPDADVHYHDGPPIEWVLGMVQQAACVVGGIGWLLPAAIAARVPMLCIGGACPNNTAERLMPAGEFPITWLKADGPDKHITGFNAALESWIHEQRVRTTAKPLAGLAA